MPIVTLTTDFGLSDYYVGIIKGALLSASDKLQLVDITHNVNNYDIVQGAFILKNAYSSFPDGTIHLVSINNYPTTKPCFIAARHDGHYFISADNGIFSLMFNEPLNDIYELDYDGEWEFPLKRVFAKAVGHIANGMPFNEIGIPLDTIEQRISFQPVITKNSIKGTVIHIDNYENVIVNISRKLFNRVGKKRPFELYFKRHNPIDKLSENYFDVPIGDVLCLINSAGYLEIAINMGKAASLLGLKVEDSVQVDFL